MERLILLLNLSFSCACNTFCSLLPNKCFYHLKGKYATESLYSSIDMVSTASMALFRQGRRLGNKHVKFPFYKTTGSNHFTFVLDHMWVKILLFTLLTVVRGEEGLK